MLLNVWEGMAWYQPVLQEQPPCQIHSAIRIANTHIHMQHCPVAHWYRSIGHVFIIVANLHIARLVCIHIVFFMVQAAQDKWVHAHMVITYAHVYER